MSFLQQHSQEQADDKDNRLWFLVLGCHQKFKSQVVAVVVSLDGRATRGGRGSRFVKEKREEKKEVKISTRGTRDNKMPIISMSGSFFLCLSTQAFSCGNIFFRLLHP